MAVRTKHGRIVTDSDLDRMAADAEAGFDLAAWKPRRRGRPSLSPGRPAHSPRLATRVPEELRSKVAARAAAEGKRVSDVMRQLLEAYAEEEPAESRQR